MTGISRSPSRRWQILSLTDLHYASPDTNYVDDKKDLGTVTGVRESAIPQFEAVLTGLERGVFDAVVVGGDITTHGQESGFKAFRDSVMPHLERLAPRAQNICVVPGNHDVVWGLDPTQAGALDQKFRLYKAALADCGVTSCLIPTGSLPRDGQPLTYDDAHPNPVLVDEDRKLIIALLNSAIRCGELNAEMQQALTRAGDDGAAVKRYVIRDVAHVTQHQRGVIQSRLQAEKKRLGDDWQAYLRVGVLHHHLVPFADQQIEHKSYESVVDAGAVLTLFGEFDFDLILTGHKHQPYVEYRTSPDNEFLVIGGPTVGGYAVDVPFRGCRIIEVEDRGNQRSVSVTDLPNVAGAANVTESIERQRAKRQIFQIERRDSILKYRTRKAGFSYREIASITQINVDGDARRVIEYEDLKIDDDHAGRSMGHGFELTRTSGYLTALQAQTRDATIRVDPAIPERERAQEWEARLHFDAPMGIGAPASYRVEWYAVNAYARNVEEFNFKYPNADDKAMEFTHFSVQEPVKELTVVVELPPEFRPRHAPKVRIRRRNPADPNGEFVKDDNLTAALSDARALRYYESLNIAALRVSYPSPDVKYGIEWEMPDAPWEDQTEGVIVQFRDGLKNNSLTRKGPRILFNALSHLLRAVRFKFADNWTGPLDGSFIMFAPGTKQPLYVLGAVIESVVGQRKKAKYQYEEMPYRGRFDYGDGIAGRAFKANQTRVYVAREDGSQPAGPDFYTKLPGIVPHKVLMSLPVHLPVADKDYDDSRDIYENSRPYGVVSFGSTNADCPLTALYDRRHYAPIRAFQHKVNVKMGECVRKILQGSR